MERETCTQDAPRSRHLRKLCGHCNEVLSYSAYRSHRALYYSKAEQRWLDCIGDDSSLSHSLHTHTASAESANDVPMDCVTEHDPDIPIGRLRGEIRARDT